MATPQYNRVIRKLVVGFGDLFNNITLVRYAVDLMSEQERFIVPIAYAAKELYVQRLQSDPDLDKKVQMTLPRMSYEMVNFSYDASRKQNTNIKNFANNLAQYNPVPYNFDFNLYIYVRNIEDGTQIIEHILPFFTPDYTIKLNLIPEMGISKDIPIVLNSTTQDIQYEGDRDSDPRLVIWTLNFTVKGFIFGSTSTFGYIKSSITNIYNEITPKDTIQFTIDPTSGTGSYMPGEIVYQGFSVGTAIATAQVVSWDGTTLVLTAIEGNFVSNKPIVGTKTNTNFFFTAYTPQPQTQAQIIVTSSPTDANGNVYYTYTAQVQETPNLANVVITTDFSGDMLTVFGADDLSIEQENPIDLGS
jgi:hypothetical protein